MDRKYSLKHENTFAISAHDADKLIQSRDGLASLLYIYLMRNSGEASLQKAALDLGKTEADVEKAFYILSSIGLVGGGEYIPAPILQEPERPVYTAEDIKNEMENGTEFPALLAEVQKSLGKMLSPDELLRLFGIYDSLSLPPEVILLLVNYCVSDYDRKYSGRRRPGMSYIEKAAYSWEKNGITTMELAERHIRIMQERATRRGQIKSVLRIEGRHLSPTEQKYIDSWCSMGFPPETVEIAYDRTVLRTGKLTWNYMDSILKSWYSKGLITPPQVLAENQKKPAQPARGKSNVNSELKATADDIEKMRRLIDEMNK